MIEFRHVSKKYKQNYIIKDLNFKVEEGEIVVLIGLSGCGKTTILKMMNQLITQSEGEIYIDNKNIESLDVVKMRRNMGYVIQQTGLFPHLTIKENIELIPKIERYGKEDREAKSKALIELVGLPLDYLSKYPNELSGGQKQRVGVARALAIDPKIILMDEPFSALDPITRETLQDELLDLQSRLKKTIVFVTHDMDEAIKIADRIAVLEKGEIIQYDTPENILKAPANEFVSSFLGKNRIWSSPQFIKVEDIMKNYVVTCYPSATAVQNIEKMRKYSVDSLIVVAPGTKMLLGVTSADQVKAGIKQNLRTEDNMSEDVLYATVGDSIIDLLKRISDISISAIPIVDCNHSVVGIITKSSLITTLSQPLLDMEGESL